MSDEQILWTFGDAYDKVRQETSLNEDDEDEEFVSFAEFVGFFNEGIDEAEAEIMLLQEDYFLAYDYMPLVADEDEYAYPSNIYGNKIRGIIYRSGGTVYQVKRYKRQDKFEAIEGDQESLAASEARYKYFQVNNTPNGRRMVLVPPARETSVLAPLTPVSTHIRRWYIRNANRVPYIGEYTNPENLLPAAFDATANTIAVDPAVTYVTGDQVKLALGTSDSTMAGGLSAATVYFVIAVSATSIKLATSLVNAQAGTAIDITSAPTGYLTLRVAATTAIVRATMIDIPEFAQFIMEWVKANCLYKDGDPRLAGTVAKLEQQRKIMQETLAEAEPDDDNVLAMDLSHYEEHA